MEDMFRSLFLWLSKNARMRRIMTQTPIVYRAASRFFAGETTAEAVAAVRELHSAGMLTTLDILGEEVNNKTEAVQASDNYLALLDKIEAAAIETDISLKLTQMGLDIGVDFCIENVSRIVSKAKSLDIFVCIDMEDSPRTDATLEVWRQLHAKYTNVGIVIQGYLFRSEADLRALADAGATVRLCKGAYKEPANVAFPEKASVDENMVKLMKMILDETKNNPPETSPYLAMATHDEKLIEATKAYANGQEIPRDRYELQMLYGIRRDLQEQLAVEGYQMRVYVPFGTEWYPYFMRRMAERPANVWFVVKALFAESPQLVNFLILTAIALILVIWGLGRRRRK
ncbi:MAG: proline dehydrogenase family protein [Anaerolineales bacterium]|nr:proline dehydrogenase family protein [Anaerolineales bacterium]